MSDINKFDIKLMESQRLDDTDQGGGQMTKNEILSGKINNLFPDISRFDRVYGRVSIRKAYVAVQTASRETYYGSHTILTEQTKDPNVSICFFSSEDWFDTRKDARNRMEAYLVKGPRMQLILWGSHYTGTSALTFFTEEGWPIPEVGDVLLLVHPELDVQQYVRVINVETESRTFYDSINNADYNKNIVSVSIGTQLNYDMPGLEISRAVNYVSTSNSITQTYTTVAADASRYYGVSVLQEDAELNQLQIRVDDIMTHLVPSAASETSITDAGVGVSVSPVVQSRLSPTKITRSITFLITDNSRLFIGEAIVPGTFEFTGGITGGLLDDGNGNIKNGSSIIGSISYSTGTITFGSIGGVNYSGTGVATYIPGAPVTQISETGAINIETNNRGFVYNFTCNPIPQSGTLRVEYLAGGKWYSMWDQGGGKISGLDAAIGSGSLNRTTGTAAVTLGSMPDVNSRILFFWGKNAEYIDVPSTQLPLRYKFSLNNGAITRTTFEFSWVGTGIGTGINGRSCIMDNGNADLVIGAWNGSEWTSTGTVVGDIQYATGLVDMIIPITMDRPKATENFLIEYKYGDKFEETFTAPPRDMDGNLNLQLTNTPILANTFEIIWHTDVVEYDTETRIDRYRDPEHKYIDDGAGLFKNEINSTISGWVRGTVNYISGAVKFSPDRIGVFPTPNYVWTDTAWLHPGVEQTYQFTGVTYHPAASLWPTEGSVTVKYCTVDGTNSASYNTAMYPKFYFNDDTVLELLPGSLKLYDGSNRMFDGVDGKIYTSNNGVTGEKLEVGSVNYVEKSFQIKSDSIMTSNITLTFATLTAAIEPTMSMVFRAPGSPIRPGSFTIRATNGVGTLLEGFSDFSGNITGNGVVGTVDFNNGLCSITFGKWVTDDASVQLEEWYENAPKGTGIVWKPYSVRASTIIVNAVITSYLPLDADLLGFDPVRLPLDGKVPIFRDGYVINIHHTETYTITDIPVQKNHEYLVGRTNLDLIEVYDTQDDPEVGNIYSSDYPEYVPERTEEGVTNYTIDLTTGKVIFTAEFDTTPYKQPFKIIHRWENMALASDVQVTGHISITTPLTHAFPGVESNPTNPTLVSSVLPSGDLQSRAYNEFEQTAWDSVWRDIVVGNPPLASFNFVDFPVTVYNKPSIKERWLILFRTTTTVDIIGENFGVMTAAPVSIIDQDGYPDWTGQTGSFMVSYPDGLGGITKTPTLIVGSKQFPGEYYWKVPLSGFGSGWQAGNCIRFNQDAANFPLWFVRTTLQAPATEPIDHYTIQVRGDSS